MGVPADKQAAHHRSCARSSPSDRCSGAAHDRRREPERPCPVNGTREACAVLRDQRMERPARGLGSAGPHVLIADGRVQGGDHLRDRARYRAVDQRDLLQHAALPGARGSAEGSYQARHRVLGRVAAARAGSGRSDSQTRSPSKGERRAPDGVAALDGHTLGVLEGRQASGRLARQLGRRHASRLAESRLLHRCRVVRASAIAGVALGIDRVEPPCHRGHHPHRRTAPRAHRSRARAGHPRRLCAGLLLAGAADRWQRPIPGLPARRRTPAPRS
jgi:hypothetical protein